MEKLSETKKWFFEKNSKWNFLYDTKIIHKMILDFIKIKNWLVKGLVKKMQVQAIE